MMAGMTPRTLHLAWRLRPLALPLTVVLALAWAGLWLYQGYARLAPALPRKVVTLQLQNAGTAKFVFSAAQPDHEVLYEMRAVLAPRMEADPAAFVGQRYEAPYQDYLSHTLWGLWWYAALALLGPAGGWACYRFRSYLRRLYEG